MAAALLVICIHTAPLASFSEPWDFALKTLARLAVPFFFTATGFFLFAGRIAPGPRPARLSPAVRRFCAKTGALYAAATLLYLPVSVYGGKLEGLSFGALVRDVVLDGTFYHLWYLPAAIAGVLLVDCLLRLPGRQAWPADHLPGRKAWPADGLLRLPVHWLWPVGAVSAALYLIGLLGDSWYGGGQALPALQALYRALFLHMDYTRCGLFFAPVFLWLGAVLRDLPRPRLRVSAMGLAVSAALLFGEAFGLRALGWPRHDSMYLALLPCTYFLFACLLAARGPSSPFLRDCSMLVYVLHPRMIVLVRGAAQVLRLQKWLVENSLIHFIAVAALSVAVSAAAAAVLPPARTALRQRLHLREKHPAGRHIAPKTADTAPGAVYNTSAANRSAPEAAAADYAACETVCAVSETGQTMSEAAHPMLPTTPATARAWAQIDLDAIAHNAQALQNCLPRSCRLMAVVKADAYGHGAPAVAGRLWRMGVRAFAVATLEEGAELRRCGITGEILILGYTSPTRVPELLRWRLSQTAADAAHAAALSEAVCKKSVSRMVRGKKALPVHIAVDTGMHRLGIPAQDVRQAAQVLQLPGLEVRGLFTHLAVSDSPLPEDEAFTRGQLAAFAAFARSLRGMGCTLPPLHALASGGILNYGQLPLQYARAGIALYGASGTRYSENHAPDDTPGMLNRKTGAPGAGTRAAPALKPALSLHARVVSVRTVPEGACAGYGRAFCAARPALLAVVSIGYADGVPRTLGEGRGTALLRGARVPIVGRVCMDQLFVDATGTGAAVGDVVTLIGRDGDACITAEEAAAAAGTIANELLCRIGTRTARVYSAE